MGREIAHRRLKRLKMIYRANIFYTVKRVYKKVAERSVEDISRITRNGEPELIMQEWVANKQWRIIVVENPRFNAEG